MKIVKINVSNFERVVQVHAAPDGRHVVLGGKNGQGKSSFLNSVVATLAGKRGGGVQVPLRTGALEGYATVELDEGLIVTRRWTPTGDTLEVRVDGRRVERSPQAYLDSLLGELSFDSMQFCNAPSKEQVSILRKLTGFDTSELDRRRAAAYDERRVVNGEAKRVRARLQSLPPVALAINLPPAPPATAALIAAEGEAAEALRKALAAIERPSEVGKEISAALVILAEKETARAALVEGQKIAALVSGVTVDFTRSLRKIRGFDGGLFPSLSGAIAIADRVVAEADACANSAPAEIAKLDSLIGDVNASVERLQRDLLDANAAAAIAADEMPKLQDALAKARDALASADAQRAAYEQARRHEEARVAAEAERARVAAEVEALDKRSADLTAEIDRIDADKLAAIHAAKMPIEGLGIFGETVTYNGFPLEQASTSERIKISVAIAAALNPEIGAIFVRDGALLDDDSQAALFEAATAAGKQVLMEVVGAPGERDGIYTITMSEGLAVGGET